MKGIIIVGIVIVLIIGLILLGKNLPGCYYCNKYCNESFKGKINCWNFGTQCKYKCEIHDVYTDRYSGKYDEDGFWIDAKKRECVDRQ